MSGFIEMLRKMKEKPVYESTDGEIAYASDVLKEAGKTSSGSPETDASEDKKEPVRRHITFFGRVQGVGFRYRAMYAARNLKLTGWVENELDGTVDMEVQGDARSISRMLSELRGGAYIEITDMEVREIPVVSGERTFSVRGY